MSFPAMYRGKCACCDEPFERNQEVKYTFEGLIIAEHERRDEPKYEFCGVCFASKAANGTCLCDV